MTNSNLALWDAMRSVDRKFTKPITGKSYKGDSPNPTYIIQKLTEQLGPIGVEWGFNVVRETIIRGTPHSIPVERTEVYENGQLASKTAKWEIIFEQHHQVEIEFWQIDRATAERRTFSAFGGTPMVYMTKGGKWITDEDAAKKSLTDAYTKAASWLGACADIFLGLFDTKYHADTPEPDAADLPPQQPGAVEGRGLPPQQPPAQQRKTTAPADDGWG